VSYRCNLLRPLRWKALEGRSPGSIDRACDRLGSFCSFAPYDTRWIDPDGNPAKTLLNIERTQECHPGKLKVREEIFFEYFGLRWNDVFTHETFVSKLENTMICYSDESLALARPRSLCAWRQARCRSHKTIRLYV
jgi:hypothetical protein